MQSAQQIANLACISIVQQSQSPTEFRKCVPVSVFIAVRLKLTAISSGIRVPMRALTVLVLSWCALRTRFSIILVVAA